MLTISVNGASHGHYYVILSHFVQPIVQQIMMRHQVPLSYDSLLKDLVFSMVQIQNSQKKLQKSKNL